MIRRREKPDGLPYRVYERRGVRVYSIGYKGDGGAWAFRLQCPAGPASRPPRDQRRNGGQPKDDEG